MEKPIGYARLVRSTVQSEKMKDYISMAKINGVNSPAILRKHLIPHVVENVMVVATMDMGKIILMIAPGLAIMIVVFAANLFDDSISKSYSIRD